MIPGDEIVVLSLDVVQETDGTYFAAVSRGETPCGLTEYTTTPEDAIALGLALVLEQGTHAALAKAAS